MYKFVFRVAIKVSLLLCYIFNVQFALRVLFGMYNAICGAYAITCVSTTGPPKVSNVVGHYSEKRHAGSLKSALKDHRQTETEVEEDNFSLVLANESSTPIVRNRQLYASSIMQSPFDPGQNPSGNESIYQDFSLMESVFCTPSKVHHCLSYLNKEFAGMGMPCVARSPSENADVVRLVNNTYRLVQRQRQTHRMKEEQEIRQIQTDGEVSRLHHVQTKMLALLEEKERKLTQLQLLVSQLETKNKQLSSALKTEKDEVQRLQSVMHQRQVQHKHESKKKELEVNRLKDRLNHGFHERMEKSGMIISAVIPPNPKFRNEESLFRAVRANYEETHRKLLLENSDFRCALCSFQNELMELVQMADPNISRASAAATSENRLDSTQVLDLSRTSSAHARDSLHKLPNAFFEMPFELVENEILRSFRQRLSRLKSIVEQLTTQATAQKLQQCEERVKTEGANRKRDEQIKRLQEKAEYFRSIANQQNAFIMSQFEQGMADVSFLRDTDHLEEERWSEADQLVADAKQRLNTVTAKIAEEMAEEQAKNYHAIQNLSMTPLQPYGGHRRYDLHGQSLTLVKSVTSKCREPLGSFNRTPSSTIRMGKDLLPLPGTAELYQKLGLSTFVHQSSPFVSKSQVAQKKLDETKENMDPLDQLNYRGDQDPLESALMSGPDKLGSPIGGSDRLRVQLFSHKPTTATATGIVADGNRDNVLQQETVIEDSDNENETKADLDKMDNDDLFRSNAIDVFTVQGSLDKHVFAADTSINFNEEEAEDFFINNFLCSKSDC